MADEMESGQELNATQLDAQRARHLLDRALGLSERGDIAGAIVTCRQSLALAPLSPQGWSMLGLLQERDGDIHGAIEAYEKVLQLSPGSIVERESLQRLRQRRGAAPRPAPKFQFEDSQPQVPSASLQDLQSDLSAPENSKTQWSTFYFRSLPLLVATVACLGFIVIAQRVAVNRQAAIVTQSAPALSTTADTSTPVQPAAPTTSPPNALASDALAPPANPAPQPDQNATAETPPPTPAAPVEKPAVAAKPKPKPRPKPQVRHTPKASPPTEMPILPAPRITLPKNNAPAPQVSDTNNDSFGANQPTGGGPVDVGNSENDKYIPINPPQFPNASRNHR